MKKVLVISLLTLLLINTTGYYLLYSLDYVAIKQEVAEMIGNLSHRETLTLSFPAQGGKTNTNDVSFTDENELIYQGRMYDVISRNESKVQIVFICYSDSRETELNENLSKKIDSDREQPSQKNKSTSSAKKLIKDFTSLKEELFCFMTVSDAAPTGLAFASSLLFTSKPVAHPPPELSLS